MSEVASLAWPFAPISSVGSLVLTGKVKQGHPSPRPRCQNSGSYHTSTSVLLSAFLPGRSLRYREGCIFLQLQRQHFSEASMCVSVFFPPAQRQEAPVFPSPPTYSLSPKSKPSPEFPFENRSKEAGQLFKNDSCLRGVNWLKFFRGSFEEIQPPRQIWGLGGVGGEGRGGEKEPGEMKKSAGSENCLLEEVLKAKLLLTMASVE